MRREFASIIIGFGFGVVFLILPYWIPGLPNWMIYLGLGIGALFIVVGFAVFFWKSTKQDATQVHSTRYENSPTTGRDHFGDIVYGNKLVNTQKETENFAPAKSKTEKIKAHIVFEEFPQNTGVVPYLSLKLFNHEQDDIEKCYGTLLELENLYTPTVTIPILEMVNPNGKFLSWGGGSPSEHVTIPRGDGVHPGVKVLNIAKGGLDVVFLFHGHESNFHGMNFRAKIKIDGEINGNPIESLVTEFCFKYGTNTYSTRNAEPEIGKKQRIVIVTSDIKSRFSFEDCDKIWK
jgi:hypothetical protein